MVFEYTSVSELLKEWEIQNYQQQNSATQLFCMFAILTNVLDHFSDEYISKIYARLRNASSITVSSTIECRINVWSSFQNINFNHCLGKLNRTDHVQVEVRLILFLWTGLPMISKHGYFRDPRCLSLTTCRTRCSFGTRKASLSREERRESVCVGNPGVRWRVRARAGAGGSRLVYSVQSSDCVLRSVVSLRYTSGSGLGFCSGKGRSWGSPTKVPGRWRLSQLRVAGKDPGKVEASKAPMVSGLVPEG
ncbi:hypothetical protein YC2023_106624 [Brassica napus]